jgi:PII-like signaling protein
MQIPEQATLLRIFLGEDDRSDGRPLYEALVLKAREMHAAIEPMMSGGLVTLEKVRVIRYSGGDESP